MIKKDRHTKEVLAVLAVDSTLQLVETPELA
jgi:hypothetical protein